jgi:hypothetical protein
VIIITILVNLLHELNECKYSIQSDISIIFGVYVNHEVKVQEDGRERHEVKTAGAEENSPELIDDSHDMYFAWCSFQWLLISKLSYSQFHIFDLTHFVLH